MIKFPRIENSDKLATPRFSFRLYLSSIQKDINFDARLTGSTASPKCWTLLFRCPFNFLCKFRVPDGQQSFEAKFWPRLRYEPERATGAKTANKQREKLNRTVFILIIGKILHLLLPLSHSLLSYQLNVSFRTEFLNSFHKACPRLHISIHTYSGTRTKCLLGERYACTS